MEVPLIIALVWGFCGIVFGLVVGGYLFSPPPAPARLNYVCPQCVRRTGRSCPFCRCDLSTRALKCGRCGEWLFEIDGDRVRRRGPGG